MEECRVALLEGRFEDHGAATGMLAEAEAELPRVQAELHALESVELELNRERQLLDWQARVAECERAQSEIGDRIQRKLAELPMLVAAAQELAADLLGEESAYQSAAHEAASLRHQIKFRDEPQIPALPRLAMSSPVSALFERHPEFRALANRTWFTGVAGGPR